LLGSETLVAAVLQDLENSPLSPAEKTLFRFVDKVNGDSPRIGCEDIQVLHDAGWSDEAIYYAVTVCALFNFYNRWVDATGVHAMTDEEHQQGGKRSAAAGYLRTA
jgi:alkylhydroperoxidase family enzyme